MNREGWSLFRGGSWLFCLAVSCFLGSNAAQAQNVQPKELVTLTGSLRITAPRAGTIFQPGQMMRISVDSPDRTQFGQVSVIGSAVGFSMYQSTVPAQFEFKIPADMSLGKSDLTATGVTTGGQPRESDPVPIYIERPDMPAWIKTANPLIIFRAIGETSSIKVLATFSDGKLYDVTHSSKTSYRSLTPDSFPVDPDGTVTAKAPGGGLVKAVYNVAGRSIETDVQVTVPPPVLIPSMYTVTFPNQRLNTASGAIDLKLTSATNTPVSITNLVASGDFSETDDCRNATPLLIGGSCTIHIVFTPTSRGESTGTLTIGNSVDGNFVRIPLKGNGQ
jgi:hypothetical protein